MKGNYLLTTYFFSLSYFQLGLKPHHGLMMNLANVCNLICLDIRRLLEWNVTLHTAFRFGVVLSCYGTNRAVVLGMSFKAFQVCNRTAVLPGLARMTNVVKIHSIVCNWIILSSIHATFRQTSVLKHITMLLGLLARFAMSNRIRSIVGQDLMIQVFWLRR